MKKLKKPRIIESLKYLTALFQIKKNKIKYISSILAYKMYRKITFPKTMVKLQSYEFIARENTMDIAILSNLYERETTKFIKSLKNNVFIDVGPYIGRFSILAENSKKIIAIDPNKDNFETLNKNILKNKLDCKIITINKGILDKKGICFLNYSSFNKDLSSFEEKNEKNIIKQKIEVDKLENIVHELGVNIKDIGLIKMDVEGVEIKALEGSKNILEKGNAIIILEANDEKEKEKLSNYLKKFNYILKEILDGRNLIFVKKP